MKSKKHVSARLLPVLFLVYLIFCFAPLRTELQLTPQWTLDITQGVETSELPLDVLPFKLGQNAGYFSHDGKLTYISNFSYKATISRDYLIPYEKNSHSFDVFDTNGNVISKIAASGFPYAAGDRIFVMLPGGFGFEYFDPQGKILNRHLHTSPITAFTSNKKLTVVGFANGVLCTFDENMNPLYELTPGGSDTEVILGASTSSKGNYFACVSGQHNQRFVLYKNEENHAKIVYHTYLPSSIVHQTLVYFSEDESAVYYNDATGLGIYDIKKSKLSHIDIPGIILNIQESPVGESLFVLSKEKIGTHNIYTITVLESRLHKTSSFSFDAESAFILTDGNSLFVGKDTKISKLTISKE